MRWLVSCLVILLLSPCHASARVAFQRPSAITTPSSFDIPAGKDISVRVDYAFRIKVPAGGEMTLISQGGSFLVGTQVIERNKLPLRVEIVGGSGGASEVIRVSAGVIERALKMGTRRFTYTRVFRVQDESLNTRVDFNITPIGLTVRSVELYFDGKRREITIPQSRFFLRAYANISLEGTGLLRGYWEIDGVAVFRITQHLASVKNIIIRSPMLSSQLISRVGMHRVRFVITEPETRIAPVISYFVLPEGSEGVISRYVSGQIIAVFEDEGLEEGYIDRLKDRYGLRVVEQYRLVSTGLRMVLFETREDDIFRIIESIKGEEMSLIVQPNHIFRTMGDPLSNRQYGNDLLMMDTLHTLYRGRGVRVAVLDTGVDTEHKDLKDRIVSSKNFLRGHSYRAEVHGTAVAGIISASINGVGIEGVAPEADIIALRACIQSSMDRAFGECFTDSLAKALDTAIIDRVDIVNMSFGGDEDGLLVRLIDRGREDGIIFVAPVGNGVTRNNLRFPASHPGVVSVGGFDERMQPYPNPYIVEKASVSAPAVNIITTFPHNRYNFISGTSLSSAYISGILAIALEKNKRINIKRLPVYNGNICRWEEQLLQISLCNMR